MKESGHGKGKFEKGEWPRERGLCEEKWPKERGMSGGDWPRMEA